MSADTGCTQHQRFVVATFFTWIWWHDRNNAKSAADSNWWHDRNNVKSAADTNWWHDRNDAMSAADTDCMQQQRFLVVAVVDGGGGVVVTQILQCDRNNVMCGGSLKWKLDDIKKK